MFFVIFLWVYFMVGVGCFFWGKGSGFFWRVVGNLVAKTEFFGFLRSTRWKEIFYAFVMPSGCVSFAILIYEL